jgi:tetratricopeptide (TPR) repeat protein
MKRRFMLLSASLLWIVPNAFAQLPPLGPPQKPAAEAAAAPAGSLSVDAANADLKIARAANQEKRYADAEALMLKDTAARPGLPYLWIELGQAQLSQKKYAEAEASFKAALSNGETAQKAAPAGGFYVAGKGTVGHISVSSSAPPTDRKDNHEIEGIANSSLGEVYIRTNRAAEGQAAFDLAVKANPTQAALYLRNETIFFLQTGNAAAQVEAANKALAIDPGRAALYFYKGQGLAAQATIDPKTQKLVLPAGCAEALQKYLDMEPAGPYATDAKGMLAAAGVAIKAGKK